MRRALLLPMVALGLTACGESITAPVAVECEPFLLEFQAAAGDTVTTALGVSYVDVVQGTGKLSTVRSTANVNYTLYGPDGSRVQTTCGSRAFQFSFEQTDLIRGFPDGIVGMREGGVRRLLIPAELAYSDPRDPRYGDLTFDIQLVKVY